MKSLFGIMLVPDIKSQLPLVSVCAFASGHCTDLLNTKYESVRLIKVLLVISLWLGFIYLTLMCRPK